MSPTSVRRPALSGLVLAFAALAASQAGCVSGAGTGGSAGAAAGAGGPRRRDGRDHRCRRTRRRFSRRRRHVRWCGGDERARGPSRGRSYGRHRGPWHGRQRHGGTGGGGTGGGATTAPIIPGAGHCLAPTGAKTADAVAAYQKWKADLLTADGAGGFLRVRRPNSNGAEVNSTVSEGIGYGMLLAVYADDQPTFDKLWQYSKLWLDSHGLMNWYINAAGTQALGTGAASDADEDIAFALVMADARWKGHGSLTTDYLELAKTQIGLIWQYEVDHARNDVLTPGDQFADGSVINISYFAPAFYRVFGRVTGKAADWMRVVDSTYTVIAATLNTANGNAQNGLVPAWSTPAGVPMSPAGQSMPTYHQLDSCRTPFRIGQDYCWNGEPRALAYLQKISGFYSTVTAAAMVDGYDLNGTPHPQFVTAGGPRAASFVGPAGVGRHGHRRNERHPARPGLRLHRERHAARRQHLLPGVLDRAVAPDDDRPPARPHHAVTGRGAAREALQAPAASSSARSIRAVAQTSTITARIVAPSTVHQPATSTRRKPPGRKRMVLSAASTSPTASARMEAQRRRAAQRSARNWALMARPSRQAPSTVRGTGISMIAPIRRSLA